MLVAVLGLVVAGAISDSPSLTSYPVLVTAATLFLVAANAAPKLLRTPLSFGKSTISWAGMSDSGRNHLLRIIGFCLLWIAYLALLNRAGFLLASSAALVGSLWITLGRFRPLASLVAVGFVLALAILVTTVLFVPVPKAWPDYWIDEALYILLEK